MKQQVSTFLLFTGQAEEAIKLYVSLFDKSEVLSIIRYGKDEYGAEGTVMNARFTLKGNEFMCIDSDPVHDFTFTPAISIFVNCSSVTEINNAYEKLSDGGKVLMPLEQYPFSDKYGWVQDKYGVSWQLSLERKEKRVVRKPVIER